MSTAIVTDSTCDLPPQLLQDYHITVLPLHITRGKESLLDGLEITAADVFAYEAATGELCSTAAVNISEFAACFRELGRKHEALVCVTIGSGFSACFQNACIAAEDVEDTVPVFVVDSRNLSSGQGLLVLEGARMAERGILPEEIAARLTDLRERVDASFILNRLDYMKKGGRCSAVTAMGANLLQIKPCIEVKDGKMRVGRKYRGHLDRVLNQFVKDRLAPYDPGGTANEVLLPHPPAEPKYMDAVLSALSADGRFSTVLDAPSGCTVACHCGPNTIGVMFLRQVD